MIKDCSPLVVCGLATSSPLPPVSAAPGPAPPWSPRGWWPPEKGHRIRPIQVKFSSNLLPRLSRAARTATTLTRIRFELKVWFVNVCVKLKCIKTILFCLFIRPTSTKYYHTDIVLAEIAAQPHFGLKSGACPQFYTLRLYSLENNNASRNIEGATTGRRAPQL